MTALSLTADSQAIALLCSSLAIPRGSRLKPLTQTEWNKIAQLIHDSEWSRPGALLGPTTDELVTKLGLPAETAARLVDLLARGGQLALELERLSSRGIWLLTRADDDYPRKLKQRLGGGAPPLFFGAGARSLLTRPGIAIVGSRNVDEGGLTFAAALARRCARDGLAVFSGGARGVDLTAMLAAVDAGGTAIGVLADSLEKLGQRRELRAPIVENELTLISPFHPAAPFNVGNAMRRNRLVYCLADAAVIVASDAESGGTRAGALENLKAQWVPLHVRADGSSGNNDLVRRGGKPMTDQTINGEEPLSLDGPNLAPQLLLDGEQEDESPEQSAPPAETDIYRLAWPQLEAFLLEPRTAKEVAEMFTLELPQARKWLKRALEEGKVTRISAHYQRIDADAQPQLWDENR